MVWELGSCAGIRLCEAPATCGKLKSFGPREHRTLQPWMFLDLALIFLCEIVAMLEIKLEQAISLSQGYASPDSTAL